MSERGPFRPGDAVLIISVGGWSGAHITGRDAVGRVYKTGNFKLRINKNRWRQSGSQAGNEYGRSRVIRADSDEAREVQSHAVMNRFRERVTLIGKHPDRFDEKTVVRFLRDTEAVANLLQAAKR